MDAILGPLSSDESFQAYLDDWRSIMESRIEQCRTAFNGVPGVEAVILAGSNGLGAAWPLSDIDLIPVYSPEVAASAAEQVEQVRAELMAPWSGTGWRTGVDVGKLAFTTDEVESALSRNDPLHLLDDDRWYHSLDKGFQGQVLIDGNGLAQRLAEWFTSWRFAPEIVQRRLRHSLHQARESLNSGIECLPAHQVLAYRHVLKCIQWSQIHLMERWGLRDNSLGRFGTRFEQAAIAHGMSGLLKEYAALTKMSPTDVHARIERSPAWVLERLDRSWRSRLRTSEAVSRLQNDRDVLRVSTDYELREVVSPPYASWLAVPTAHDLADRCTRLHLMLDDLSTSMAMPQETQ